MENGKAVVCFICRDGFLGSPMQMHAFSDYLTRNQIRDVVSISAGLQTIESELNYKETIRKVDILVSLLEPSGGIEFLLKTLGLREDASLFYLSDIYKEHRRSEKAVFRYLARQARQKSCLECA
ncbi:MAG: hypothetical protein PHH00_00120 [Candidatus Nanoarchaeia archaeon]|nr:hypothetical protein [Candidatus Nanoarchaeia archaeon]